MNRTLTIFNILKGIDLKGGSVYAYSRVPNSTKLDVVVTDEMINIHALNTKDTTQPNLPDFKYALDKIHERLGFLDDGEVKKGQDSVWYLSISLENLDDVMQDVVMHENKSLTDGYGGSVAFNENVWQGNLLLISANASCTFSCSTSSIIFSTSCNIHFIFNYTINHELNTIYHKVIVFLNV